MKIPRYYVRAPGYRRMPLPGGWALSASVVRVRSLVLVGWSLSFENNIICLTDRKTIAALLRRAAAFRRRARMETTSISTAHRRDPRTPVYGQE